MIKKILKGFFISVCVFILFTCLAILFVIFILPSNEYKNPKDYKIIKEKIVEQKEISHFPKEIPEDATEVSMFGYTDMPWNGEMLILNFKINRKYIEKELNKYEFWNKNDKIGTKRKIYNMPKFNKKFNKDNYTYYVLKEPENEVGYKKYFPYYNGIGIDGKNNKILYYHIHPID